MMDPQWRCALYVCLIFVTVCEVSSAAVSEEQLGHDLVQILKQELGGTQNDGNYGKRDDTDPCDPSPCENNSECTTSEQPLADIGIYSYCLCKAQVDSNGVKHTYGGYFCEIEDPCDACPSGTIYCVATNMDSDGKFCYDSNYDIND